ncbi:unknown [Segatella copri CAG:164]|nr:unknown [Segatella copri CAG:164]
MDAKVSKKTEFYFIIITKYFILCNTYICTFTAFPTYSTLLLASIG